MSITLQVPEPLELRPRLTVIGVGGAGCNAVNNMIAAGLDGVDFMVANTDAQALVTARTPNRVQLGQTLTEGLGAGSKPEIGEAAAREAEEDLRSRIAGSHMLFIAAGMGGGTGTGAAAVIGRIARDLGILTVAVVTKPFLFEGSRRMRVAEQGITELRKVVDTLIVIPNQNLFRIADERTTFAEAFILADQVLYSGVACIVDLIVKEGLINLDLADVKTVLTGMGPAVMGTGEAEGDRRAVRAAEAAIENKLLDDVSLSGAKGLLLSIIGGPDLTLYEVDEAASRVRREVDPDANIIVGAAFDASLGDRVRVSIVASGLPVGAEAVDPSRQQPAAMPVRREKAPVSREPTGEPVVVPSVVRAGPPPLPPSAQTRPPVSAATVQQPNPGDTMLDGWRSPEGVFVKEVTPAPIAQSVQKPAQDAAKPTVFVPQPAAEVRRPAPRIPAIGDFPDNIQKAYAEQQATAPGQASANRPSDSSRDQVVRAAEARKGGLFQRLADAARGRPKAADGSGDNADVADFLAEPSKARGR